MSITQSRCLFKTLIGLLSKGFDGLATFEQVLCGVAYQLDKNAPVASATAPKATQDFFELLLQAFGLALERRGPPVALLGDTFNQLKGFF